MKQSSEKFMDEMLKDTKPSATSENLSEKLADLIDRKMDEAMKKFQAEASKISPPVEETETVETPEETEDEDETVETDTNEEGE